LNERIGETRRGADLWLCSWDEEEGEDLAPEDRYLNSEEREELDKLGVSLSPTAAYYCRSLLSFGPIPPRQRCLFLVSIRMSEYQ
jgi:hypothetical protein